MLLSESHSWMSLIQLLLTTQMTPTLKVALTCSPVHHQILALLLYLPLPAPDRGSCLSQLLAPYQVDQEVCLQSRHMVLGRLSQLLKTPDHEVCLQSRYMVKEVCLQAERVEVEVGLQAKEGVEVVLDPVHLLQVWPLVQMWPQLQLWFQVWFQE